MTAQILCIRSQDTFPLSYITDTDIVPFFFRTPGSSTLSLLHQRRTWSITLSKCQRIPMREFVWACVCGLYGTFNWYDFVCQVFYHSWKAWGSRVRDRSVIRVRMTLARRWHTDAFAVLVQTLSHTAAALACMKTTTFMSFFFRNPGLFHETYQRVGNANFSILRRLMKLRWVRK